MYLLDDDTAQDDQMQTLHVYVYDDEPRRPMSQKTKDTILGIGTIIFILSGIIALCLIPNTPAYAIQTVSVPAQLLPVVHLTATAAIIPTGSKTSLATYAEGTLTLYNGSILNQALPAGFIVTSTSGIEIVTDESVTIPPGNAPNYGTATVTAHAAKAGADGNIAAYAINAVYGADVYIKNLWAFSGGADAQTTIYATDNDIHRALTTARTTLSAQEHQQKGLLSSPCQETTSRKALLLTVGWACQFVTFTAPKGAQVLAAQVAGNYVVLRVKTAIPHQPTRFVVK